MVRASRGSRTSLTYDRDRERARRGDHGRRTRVPHPSRESRRPAQRGPATIVSRPLSKSGRRQAKALVRVLVEQDRSSGS